MAAVICADDPRAGRGLRRDRVVRMIVAPKIRSSMHINGPPNRT
jgi:hypothetical protein